MDDRDEQDPGRAALSAPPTPRPINDDLIQALVRLAQADFSVRLPRNFKRDADDVLALFVNLIAEELDRLTQEREQSHRALEEGVERLSEHFLALAAGDFEARAARSFRGDPLDVLAFLFNNTAVEVGEAFGEIERQREVLQTILDSMIDGVLLLDAETNVRRANAGMARLLGRPVEEFLRRPLAEILSPRERVLPERLRAISEEGPFRGLEAVFQNAAGQMLPLTVNGSPQTDREGALTGVVLVARDDRELKEAQARLQLADRLATMGTVAAGVAHEINNPLAFISSNLEFALEELGQMAPELSAPERLGEVLAALEACRGGAERVRLIVRDLKSFSRVEHDATGPVDLSRLLDSTISMIKNEVRHHARLVKEAGPCPLVEGNDARLIQVFLNLIQNAAQAIPLGNVEGNSIRVVIGTTSEGDAKVEIVDTGGGIPEQDRERIFEAFYTTKPVGVGTGLGLAICRKLVGGMGGRLELESELGKGSTFRVVLPARPS